MGKKLRRIDRTRETWSRKQTPPYLVADSGGPVLQFSVVRTGTGTFHHVTIMGPYGTYKVENPKHRYLKGATDKYCFATRRTAEGEAKRVDKYTEYLADQIEWDLTGLATTAAMRVGTK